MNHETFVYHGGSQSKKMMAVEDGYGTYYVPAPETPLERTGVVVEAGAPVYMGGSQPVRASENIVAVPIGEWA